MAPTFPVNNVNEYNEVHDQLARFQRAYWEIRAENETLRMANDKMQAENDRLTAIVKAAGLEEKS
jgi:hypothetical protein